MGSKDSSHLHNVYHRDQTTRLKVGFAPYICRVSVIRSQAVQHEESHVRDKVKMHPSVVRGVGDLMSLRACST